MVDASLHHQTSKDHGNHQRWEYERRQSHSPILQLRKPSVNTRRSAKSVVPILRIGDKTSLTRKTSKRKYESRVTHKFIRVREMNRETRVPNPQNNEIQWQEQPIMNWSTILNAQLKLWDLVPAYITNKASETNLSSSPLNTQNKGQVQSKTTPDQSDNEGQPAASVIKSPPKNADTMSLLESHDHPLLISESNNSTTTPQSKISESQHRHRWIEDNKLRRFGMLKINVRRFKMSMISVTRKLARPRVASIA